MVANKRKMEEPVARADPSQIPVLKNNKPVTLKPERRQDLVVHPTEGLLWRCPKPGRADPSLDCGSLTGPSDHDITSHLTKQHKNDSAYDQAQSGDRPVIGCLVLGCEYEGWGNLNAFNGHLRSFHGLRPHEADIKRRLVRRARNAGDTANPWYDYVVIETENRAKKHSRSEDDEDEAVYYHLEDPEIDHLAGGRGDDAPKDDDNSGGDPPSGGAIPPIAVL